LVDGHEDDVREKKVVEEEVSVARDDDGGGSPIFRFTSRLVPAVEASFKEMFQHLPGASGHHRVPTRETLEFKCSGWVPGRMGVGSGTHLK